MKFELTNEELEMVLSGLRNDADGCGVHEPSCRLADRLEALSLKHCPASADGTHAMVQPDDTAAIKWDTYGLCVNCKAIRRME